MHLLLIFLTKSVWHCQCVVYKLFIGWNWGGEFYYYLSFVLFCLAGGSPWVVGGVDNVRLEDYDPGCCTLLCHTGCLGQSDGTTNKLGWDVTGVYFKCLYI